MNIQYRVSCRKETKESWETEAIKIVSDKLDILTENFSFETENIDENSVQFSLTDGRKHCEDCNEEELLFSFEFADISGQCGAIISTDTSILNEYRNKGVGTELQSLKERIAKDLGYSAILATTRASNSAETRVLEKTGWKSVSSFINSRTSNQVLVWIKKL